MKVLRRVVVIIAALALLAGVVGVIVYGYKTRPGWVGVSDKKFWDYLELLIVPAALALGVYWLNRAQREREREAEGAQQELELAVQSQRAKDAALQAYFDQISQLLIDRDLRGAQPGDNLSVVARARTLTVLQALDRDPKRKRILMQFLYEAQLILRNNSSSEFLYEASGPVISLIGADLTRADLGKPI